MPRKILLSFLGTNNYEPVSYYVERSSVAAPLEKYVQKTILNHLAADFGSDDQAYIFLTEEARSANWENDGHYDYKAKTTIPNVGLGQQIEQEAYHFGVSPVAVSGESEPEAIWETFERVYECIHEADEVYLDITHSWRYLPMLGMTLLNYAKVLKNIEVNAIYYGAFEQLGTAFEVRNLPEDERPVPILDLVSFSELQDWTIAADDFVRDGNPSRLSVLTQKNLSPILAESKGKDETARNLSEITNRLNKLVGQIGTNRGREIWSFDYHALKKVLAQFSEEQSYIKPLNGVIAHIKTKVDGFEPANQSAWLEAVQWCIDHGLVQQGITQLQEGLITWLCYHYEQKGWGDPGYFDPHQNRRGRDLLSTALQFITYMPEEERWSGQVAQHKALTYRIMEDEIAQKLAPLFRSLATNRNDINHGGYTENSRSDKFYGVLEKSYKDIREVLLPYMPKVKREIGLLNLSNHPSSGWTDAQRKAAEKEFGPVEDLPFPSIPPDLEEEALQQLVEEYHDKVLDLAPTAVHIMGEMTFTFALVQRLKEAAIPCVASTTKRLVNEQNGNKVVAFQFVRFRTY